VASPPAGLRPSHQGALVPADSGGLQRFDEELGCLLQHAGEAFLDRIGGLARDLAREFPKLPALRGRGFEVLAALLSGKLQDFRGQFRAQEMGKKIKGGAGIGAGELDDFGGVERR
jgi:hypothetical protein